MPIPMCRRICSDFFAHLATNGMRYRHTAEGPDDMPCHIRSALTQTQHRHSAASRPAWRWAPGRGFMSSNTATRRTGAKWCCTYRATRSARPCAPVPSATLPAARRNARSLPPPPGRPAGRNRLKPLAMGQADTGSRRRTGRRRRWCPSPASPARQGWHGPRLPRSPHSPWRRRVMAAMPPQAFASRSRRRSLVSWNSALASSSLANRMFDIACPADAGIRRGSGRRKRHPTATAPPAPPAPFTAAIALREASLALSSSHR